MISKRLITFFRPIFSEHKNIFLLLMFGGFIGGIGSIITPILLKLEMDQLVEKKSFGEFEGFEVFVIILCIIIISHLITRIIERVTDIFTNAKKEYLQNSIHLELFRYTEEMEVGRTMNNRFRYLSRIIESEFSNFSDSILRFPGGFLLSLIQVFGITAIFVYFDYRFLLVVILTGVINYYIDRYIDILREKYEVQHRLSLGHKLWTYQDLFLRSFPQLATNGAVSSTIIEYENLLDREQKNGLRKNWAEMTWVGSGFLTGSLSDFFIKTIVGYGVFQGTQSVGMVTLVVSSMGIVEGIIRNAINTRKNYLRFRLQEQTILLFLDMCSPIGNIKKWDESIEKIVIKDVSFSYPNLLGYEKRYLEIAKNYFKNGKTGSSWIDESFDGLIQEVEGDIGVTKPTILQNISMTLEKGKIYGIVGKNGAGKTTLMHLVSGFFRGYDGSILLNTSNTKDWSPTLFAKSISFLTQQPFLLTYSHSVAQNLFFGVIKKDEEQAWKYLEQFGLAEKVRLSKNGIASIVGEEIDFSGGEYQLIAFIRILLQNRPIIIMDEGTNQLDAENELIVMNELYKNKKDKIIIFITHRMSTISRADYIYNLEDTHISEPGRHRELLNQGSNAYARFYRAQILHEDIEI